MVLYGAVVVERGDGAVADRFIGNRIINSPYPATGSPLCLRGQGVERLERRATDAYPGKLLQAGGSPADAGTGLWGQSW